MRDDSASAYKPITEAQVTQHAALRMQQRGIRTGVLEQVLTYGRRIHAKGMTYCAIGRKEVSLYASRGLDLSAAAGVQALVSQDGAVVTVYRNHDFHGIRAPKRYGPPKHRTAAI